MPTRYLVVLGSLLSGIGKGIASSSIAKVLSTYDLNVMPLKFDGYLNYDCGTMNPLKHGEVFVLDDKSEVDMDFGTYERFLNRDFNGAFSLTGGKLFSEIIAKERKGDFLGSDVQIIPHMTDLILKKLKRTAEENKLDVMLIEVGGTVGDIENSYFIEAIRELAIKEKVVFVAVTYVPELDVVGEQKTKPTQLALRSLMQIGIQPDFIITRSENPLKGTTRDKIALFANLPPEHIIDNRDTNNIYRVPINFMDNGFAKLLLEELGYGTMEPNGKKLESWKSYISSMEDGNKDVNISIVGKYVNLHDSYVSINEAIVHASAALGVHPVIRWIEAERFEEDESRIANSLEKSNGILVPYGFGSRGTEGMLSAIRYSRENRIPYLGICFGMQLMAIEFARNVAGLSGANSSEIDMSSAHKIIDIMETQKGVTEKGGTMRLGSWPAKVRKGTYAYDAYREELIHERHRHRYEFNNSYRESLESLGLRISATTPDDRLVEIIEWKDSFGMGTQAHPELKSRPERPAPMFVEFIKHAAGL
ncbi:MAG: CTP synthase [Candidatus Micrarchaeota archaeon]|nr:CTP synthase [Candidatus Micrarchaeota archaeon]